MIEVHCPDCEISVVRVVGSVSDDVKYCSPACARRAKKLRRGAQLDQWLTVLEQWEGICDAKSRPRCPATGKIRYVSKAQAWVLISQRHPTVPTLQPYPYPCDSCTAWHIGNSKSVSKGLRAKVMRQIDEAKRVRAPGPTTPEHRTASLPVLVSVTVDVDNSWDHAPVQPVNQEFVVGPVATVIAAAIAAPPTPDTLPGTVLEREETARQ